MFKKNKKTTFVAELLDIVVKPQKKSHKKRNGLIGLGVGSAIVAAVANKKREIK